MKALMSRNKRQPQDGANRKRSIRRTLVGCSDEIPNRLSTSECLAWLKRDNQKLKIRKALEKDSSAIRVINDLIQDNNRIISFLSRFDKKRCENTSLHFS